MYSLCNPVSETILKKVFSLWSVWEKLAGNVAVLPSINNKVKKEEKEIFRPNSSSRQEFYHFQSEHVNDNNFMRAVAAVGLGGIRKLNKIIKMWSWSSSRLRHSSPLSRQAAWWSWRKLAEERNPDFNQQFLGNCLHQKLFLFMEGKISLFSILSFKFPAIPQTGNSLLSSRSVGDNRAVEPAHNKANTTITRFSFYRFVANYMFVANSMFIGNYMWEEVDNKITLMPDTQCYLPV